MLVSPFLFARHSRVVVVDCKCRVRILANGMMDDSQRNTVKVNCRANYLLLSFDRWKCVCGDAKGAGWCGWTNHSLGIKYFVDIIEEKHEFDYYFSIRTFQFSCWLGNGVLLWLLDALSS